jgi:hypothetical protein
MACAQTQPNLDQLSASQPVNGGVTSPDDDKGQAQEPSQKMQPGQQIQPSQQIQDDADKGIKTRNSGDSGLVADQEKPAAAAHPPGQPDQSTTGTSSGSGKSR